MTEVSNVYREIVELSSQAYVVVDFEGEIIFANKAFETLSKYSLQQLRDIKLAEITIGEELVHHIIKTTADGRPLIALKTAITPKSGPLIPVSLSTNFIASQKAVLFSFGDLRSSIEGLNEKIELQRILAKNLWIGLFEWGIDGPTPKVTELPSFLNTDARQEDFLVEIAAIFSLNLPQGLEDQYNLGLFGFVPIPRVIDQVALLYTFKIGSEDVDRRFEGVGYAFLVIAIPKKIQKFFTNRDSITKTIERHLTSAVEITEIKLETLLRIKQQIIDVETSL